MLDSGNSPYNSRLLRIYRIIECPICCETFRRTAVLPCAHTFCLRCLSRYVSDENSSTGATAIVCPICRKRFELPNEKGLGNLPRNFVVEGVVETLIGRSSICSQDNEVRLCALCSETELVENENNQAVEFCRQCRHNLCASCTAQHKLLFQMHRVCPIGSSLGATKSSRHLKRRQHNHFCNKHKKDELSFYCFHCSTTTCAICRHQLHRHHDCPLISDVFDDFVDEIQFELNEVTDFCTTAEYMCTVLERNKERVKENCSGVKECILRSNAQYKNMIDCQTNQLLEQLANIQDSRLAELNEHKIVLQTRLNTLNMFVKCYERLKDVATPHDVALRISEFHEKSALLLDVQVISQASHVDRKMPRVIYEDLCAEKRVDFGKLSFDIKLDALNIQHEVQIAEQNIYFKIKKFLTSNESIILLFFVILIIFFYDV